MTNCNVPDTEKIKLAWPHHEKRRRQPLRKNYEHGSTGDGKKGRPRRIDNNREDMKQYEMTADMIEHRHYWELMVKTGQQRCVDGL